MASDARNTAAAINAAAAAAAISSADLRYPPPEQRRWKGYWARYWCFGSQKRDKRIVPASRGDPATGSARRWNVAGPAQAGLGLAPPSSPASFVNSSVQSPAGFSLSLAAASASMFSPGPRNTMFTIGPYAHETQLVSPPVFSTFTTEPSTAPLTPPPELAHLTTPSSPDVPFAQLIASSLEAKGTARESISPFSTSTLASPCETPPNYMPSSDYLYLGSPVGHLVSPPTSGYVGTETSSAMPDVEFPVKLTAFSGPFLTFEPFTCSTFDGDLCVAATSSHAAKSEFLTSQDDGDLKFRSGLQLDLRSNSDSQRGIGSMSLLQTDTNHASATIVSENDNEPVGLSVKGDDYDLLTGNGIDASSFCRPAKSNQQIFLPSIEDGCWNVSSKIGYCINVTHVSTNEDMQMAEIRQSPLVVELNQKSSIVGPIQMTDSTSPDVNVDKPISPFFLMPENTINDSHWIDSGNTRY